MTGDHRKKKYIFVTGGVVSSLGKGITASSLGALFEARGLRVSLMKLDPYLNVDPGTLSPFQHGEVFVTDDGAETDLDLGHYERFTSAKMSKAKTLTAGKVYLEVINRERRGDFGGKTVQVVPHVTNVIKEVIHDAAKDCEILFVEIGGTVGDIESQPFLETVRQLRQELGPKDAVFVHVTLVPYLKAAGELKTKPTQHSVRELRASGITPDMLILRSDTDIPDDVKEKIGRFCDVPVTHCIACPDLSSIYLTPLHLHEQKADAALLSTLDIWAGAPQLEQWKRLQRAILKPAGTIRIAMVGKYHAVADSYKSVSEALLHAGYHHNHRVEIVPVNSEELEANPEAAARLLDGVAGVLVPGGFGDRGTEGKIRAIEWARTRSVPFLGICLGMQLAVVEFARHVAGLEGAHSREFAKDTPWPVVDLMEGQQNVQLGGTMRLGKYDCALTDGTRAAKAYGTTRIEERHRHRYEVSNRHRERLVEKGLVISGINPDQDLVEMIELPEHPFFVGCQFHPEFKSRPTAPHPLFRDFVGAALAR